MTGIIENGIVAGNVFDKHTSRNPLVRILVSGFLNALRELVSKTGAGEAHEIGCGEGYLSVMLATEGLKMRASDVSSEIISYAKKNAKEKGVDVSFHHESIYDLAGSHGAAELIVCCEVMEHLPDPYRALAILETLAKPNLIVSVPQEPIWRVLNCLRLKYLRQWGNTPGHVNHWSRKAFLQFLATRLDVVECRTPFPWTMVWCRIRASNSEPTFPTPDYGQSGQNENEHE